MFANQNREVKEILNDMTCSKFCYRNVASVLRFWNENIIVIFTNRVRFYELHQNCR